MKKAYEIFRSELDSIKEAGTYKDERIITTPQKARIDTTVAKGVLNMCAKQLPRPFQQSRGYRSSKGKL